jgi:hypothetical protein
MLSPYKAAKLVNEILDAHDLASIPPQMVYNYVRKGYILSTQDAKGKILVDEMDFENEKGFGSWMKKYLEGKGVVVESDENPDQLTLDDIEA